MKKAIIALLTLAVVSAAVFPEAAGTSAAPVVGSDDPNKIGIETAQQKLKEVSVDKFEAAGFWDASISADAGIVTSRLFEGRPAGSAAEPVADPRYVGKDPKLIDKYVYGVKTEFYARGFNDIIIKAKRPIPIEGITKTISVWVAGRNFNNVLWIELKDFFGTPIELPMGKLNFQGWKKISVAIPPQNPDGRSGIIQRNFHYVNRMGLRVVGFRIECDPAESFGTYYIYFDDLRAVTDLFAEDMRDPDDMSDSW
jgi:Flagellar filament outer layer protein Flaa